MALVHCIECKHEISTKADFCPHCGHKNLKVYEYLKTIIAIVGVIIVCYAYVDIVGESDKPISKPISPPTTLPTSPIDTKSTTKQERFDINTSAAGACMLAIKKQLHDPSTAQFDYTYDAKVIRENDSFTVYRNVRAKNAMGALVFTKFECRLHYKNDFWKILSVKQLKT